MIIIKIILIVTFALIFYQDYKERMVYWFLFPLVGLCAGYLYYNSTPLELFISSVVLNFCFVLILLLLLKIIVNLLFKKKFNVATGLGDVLLFLSLAFTFSTYSFYVIFAFGLIFTTITHLFLKKYYKIQHVPTAGYMSIFFGLSYIIFWTGINNSLYAI